MSQPVIHRRRTIPADALERLRSKIRELRESTETDDFRAVYKELSVAYDRPEKDVILQSLIDGGQIEILEWVIRELLQETP